jgi:hypothetical protein
MPCALFVDPRGPYPTLLGRDRCWDEARDARTYDRDDPVVVHPPCAAWGQMVRINAKRYGTVPGADGGLFACALEIVRRVGGVLEHPMNSLAFAHFGLGRPSFGAWSKIGEREWTTCVWQSTYGHVARKATWLLLVGDRPFDLDWRKVRGTHTIGGGINTGWNAKPRASDAQALLTPVGFAVELINLASWCHQA